MRLRPQVAAVHAQACVPIGTLGRIARETKIWWIGKRIGLGNRAVTKMIQAGMVGAGTEPLTDHRHEEGCGSQ